MKFGFFIPTMAVYADPEKVVNLAVMAEKHGWDGVFLPDHLMHVGRIPWLDTNIMMATIASRTERITIGTWITPVPRRQPWQLAKELATLDILSGGRILLGAGSGSPKDDFESFGMEYKNMGEKLDEALRVLELCWKGEEFDFEGKHYNLKKVKMLPVPVQKPRIPILIAGRWPHKKPIERAARWDGMVPVSTKWPAQFTEEELREMISYFKEKRKEYTDKKAEILIQADMTEFDMGFWKDLASELGITWILLGLSPQSRLTSDQIMEKVKEGPPQ